MSLDETLRQQLVRWNDTTHPFTDNANISTLLERQIEQSLDDIALIFESETWTYRVFDERVNGLAAYLQNLQGASGLIPDTLIPVFFERGFEMLVGIHAVVRAGGAYVPLDVDAPAARIDAMLAELNAPCVLTTSDLAEKLHALEHCPVEVLEVGRFEPPRVARRVTSAAGARSLCYMIYTSGSTGTPKGVMVEHQALINRLEWMQAAYPLSRESRVLHKTPYTFDVSVWELFWPFLVGASLVIAKPRAHMHMRYLAKLIRDAKVSELHFVPSLFSVFVETQEIEELTSLKRVFCSGEALPTDATHPFLTRQPGCEVHNLYGPTEAAIDVSYWPCSPLDVSHGPLTPIGWPVHNTQLLILDEAGEPVGVGVEGELFILGVQLARGYYKRPELTEERFVRNPFQDSLGFSSPRMYRTGDLARFNADGAIEFLGRTDFQVKIHGLRVELGEIEAAIRDSGVSACVVLAVGAGEEIRLIAFLQSDAVIREPELKEHLARRLPPHMIPRRFVSIAELPLTTSGKIDRKELLRQLGQS